MKGVLEMVEGTRKLLEARYYQTAKRHLCPQCRGEMAEVDRVNENGFSFVWYECTRPDCDGQWLEKRTVGVA